MTDPIVSTTRISDRPVRWQTRFAAYGSMPDGQYSVELIGTGRTPELAQARAPQRTWTGLRLDCLLLRLSSLAASPEASGAAEKA